MKNKSERDKEKEMLDGERSEREGERVIVVGRESGERRGSGRSGERWEGKEKE